MARSLCPLHRPLLPLLFHLLGCAPPVMDGDMAPPPPAEEVPDLTPPESMLPRLCIADPRPASLPGSDSCPAPASEAPDSIDGALSAIGMTRCDVQIPPEAVLGTPYPAASLDPNRLPDFDALHRGPLRLPGYGHETGAWLAEALGGTAPVSQALAAASSRLGHHPATCLDLSAYETLLRSDTPLADALSILIAAHGGTADRAALKEKLAPLPGELQRALWPVVAAIDQAARAVRTGRGTTDAEVLAWLWEWAPYMDGVALTEERVQQLAAVQVGPMSDAAALIAAAVHAMPRHLPTPALEPIDIDTPLGKVLLRGPGADEHRLADTDRVVLLVDLGGDDRYLGPVGAATLDLPVAVALDLSGADQYGYEQQADPNDRPGRLPADAAGRAGGTGRGRTNSRTGRQGSGVLGIGMLFDLGTASDRYQSLTLSQGSGFFGVGVLYDEGGDDDYRAEVISQGVGAWGVGLLLDHGGNDAYRTFAFSQGFGFIRGAGVLADRAGDDLYFANPGDPAVKADPAPLIGGDPMYPSSQLPSSGNFSMAQGAGYGRRGDLLADKKFFLSGGLGVLFDGAGQDRYLASVFGQGTGYFRGVGLLLDRGGDDVYEGLWYVQGAAAHASIGALLDDGGDDRYNPTFPIRSTSVGVGNDYSIGVVVDGGGDDSYRAPATSLGTGYAQGVGILLDRGGADRYEAAGHPTLGAATISTQFPFTRPRAQSKTIGLFVDAGGADQYVAPMSAGGRPISIGNEGHWSFPEVLTANPDKGVPLSERTCGFDDDQGALSIP